LTKETKILSERDIYYALELGFFEMATFLIENGAGPHPNNTLALIKASQYELFDIVRFLVENGAKIHHDNDQALFLASSNGHFEVVRWLPYRI
jgi:hypothetical protein